MTIIEKINSEYPRMTKSEKAFSAYLLSHLDELEFESIQTLAVKNGLSTPTLIRYARKLGYEGFRDFKQAVSRNAVVQPNLINKFENIACFSGNRILQDTISQSISCIENTFSQLSPETLQRCISLLTDSRRVYTFGMKESYAPAHYAYTRLYTVRGDVFLLGAANGDLEPILDMSKDDCCLVFLFHRYTRRAVEILQFLKKTGASVILITNEPSGDVSPFADCIINCSVYSIGIKNTFIAPISLCDCFCNVMAASGSDKTIGRLKRIEELLEGQSEQN